MKKGLYFVLCASLAIVLVGCAGDGELSKRRDNTFSAIGEALQKGVEAEKNKGLSESGGTPGSGSDTDVTGIGTADTIDWESSDWWSDEETDLSDDGRQNGLSYGAHIPSESDLAEGDTSSAGGIDIDLTEMSSTMVYAEVYFMMVYPDRYIGKKIKADGLFATYHDEVLDKMYYACIVKDATECCAQGLEFALKEEKKYPEEFPKEGEDVCVTGIFDTYVEGDGTYAVLKDAVMLYGEDLK
ncbi:MAG: hypothetical protein K6E95_06295 [Lachnospiraceae bacterium]|nr:hypothetical protein [Lachnospiraceae bacterium]